MKGFCLVAESNFRFLARRTAMRVKPIAGGNVPCELGSINMGDHLASNLSLTIDLASLSPGNVNQLSLFYI